MRTALEAYRSLKKLDKRTQGRIAKLLCEIANIAEITNHPAVAIEYYLDALWYLSASGQQPQAKQVIQQLNQLCDMSQPVGLTIH
ncbi:MAG: hypothetical protein F6K11_16570 [Leptolyngbya sp. SIO3F4]|nr:hypothetical protein [Leptolyngbya sp. SIO3F4]